MAGRPQAGLRPGPLVGRDAELSALARVVADARAGGGGAVFVAGEPGIGKTRLVDELAGSARSQGVPVLRGRAVRGGGAAMRPFAEALMALTRDGWSPPAGLGPYLAVLGHLVPDWRAADTIAPANAPFVYGEAILRLLGTWSAQACLLLLEDLHDADPDTIGTLEYLVDHAGEQALAVVCTVRDVSCPALDLAHYAQRRDPDALLTLARLDRAATAELAEGLLGAAPGTLPAALHDAVSRDSAGHPLVVTEMLRESLGSRALVHHEGAWALADPRRVRAPRTLARDITDRLRRTDPLVRRLLHGAAVLGRDFPGELAGAAAGVEAPDLWPALDAAVRAQFLVAGPEAGWFAFHHPMIEQAVQAQLTPPAFRELALAAAAAIEQQPAGFADEWGRRAAELRQAAGDADGAGRLFTAAARRALRGGSPALAVDLLRQARGCLPPQRRDARWAETTGLLISALGTTGHHQEAFTHADDLPAPATAELPPQTIADLHIRFARTALRASLTERALQHVAAARQVIGDRPAGAQRAELYAIEAHAACDGAAAGQVGAAAELAQRAIDAARASGTPEVECDALLTLGYLHGSRRPERALACYQDAHRLARAHNLPGQRLETLLLMASHQWMWHADPSGLEAAHAEANAAGAVIETRLTQLFLAVDALFRARFDTARDLLGTAWTDISRLGMPGLASYAQAVRALLHAHQGREGDLADAVADFDRWRGERENEVPLVRGLALGFGALLRGDTGAARGWLRKPPAEEAEDDSTKYYLCGEYGLALLVDAVEGSADWRAYQAIDRHPASRLPWNRQFVHLAQAVLLGADGDAAGAQAAADRALAAGAPFPLARHLGLRLVAPAAARDGWGEPVRWLQEAEAFFTEAGNPPAAKCCRGLLRGLGGPVRQRRPGSLEIPRRLWTMGVTVREYEILVLVARRRTNREIAAELHLSHRTVERHVASLLAKTGTANRRDLAALALPVLSAR